jgi:acyl-coenzyme A thioesterase PaaI-like protein
VIAGPGVQPFELTEHNCFGCGSLNTHGLQLVLHVEPGRSWTALALDERFEGWAGMAHGGIVCAILDEVMAWALVGDDNWGVTARMAVDFRRPIAMGQPVRAEGRILRSRRRVVDTAGRLIDPASGAEFATATATYMAADGARRRELQQRYGFRYADSPEPQTAATR